MSTGAAMSTLVTSLTSGFTTVANDSIDAIGSIVPTALPILGAIIVIGIAVKVFRKFTR